MISTLNIEQSRYVETHVWYMLCKQHVSSLLSERTRMLGLLDSWVRFFIGNDG